MKISQMILNMRGERRPPGPDCGYDDGLVVCRVMQPEGYPLAPFPMCFSRRAFLSLLQTVGRRPPESGAMGFGPKDRFGFDIVEFDEKGSSDSGGAVYRPSVEWRSSRQDYHLRLDEAEMKIWSGDAHSHPAFCCCPSGKSGQGLGDLGYVEEVFAMNEAMQWFLIPIITGSGTDDISIHPWICRRGKPLDLFIADFRLCRDSSEFPKREFNPDWELRVEREMAAQTGHRTEAAAVASENKEDEARRNAGRPKSEATSASLQEDSAPAVTPAASPVTRDCGPTGGDAPADSSERNMNISTAQIAGLSVRPDDPRLQLYTKRLEGIVSPRLRDKTILTIGIGGGSYAVEELARLCPKRLKICDFDFVELQNLCRTVYTVEDADCRRPKVEALARRISQINPWVEVKSYPKSFTDMCNLELDSLFDGVDLIIAGTDKFQAQALANIEAVRRNTPAVFIGIHEGARGGRVVWSLPDVTPCYRCVARERYEDFERGGSDERVDLDGAAGSIFDGHFVDAVAMKIAVAILERGETSMMGRFFARMGDRNDIVIRCDPEYAWGTAMWDAVLSDLPREPKDFAEQIKEQALFAMDTLWFRTARDPFCPVCAKQ